METSVAHKNGCNNIRFCNNTTNNYQSTLMAGVEHTEWLKMRYFVLILIITVFPFTSGCVPVNNGVIYTSDNLSISEGVAISKEKTSGLFSKREDYETHHFRRIENGYNFDGVIVKFSRLFDDYNLLQIEIGGAFYYNLAKLSAEDLIVYNIDVEKLGKNDEVKEKYENSLRKTYVGSDKILSVSSLDNLKKHMTVVANLVETEYVRSFAKYSIFDYSISKRKNEAEQILKEIELDKKMEVSKLEEAKKNRQKAEKEKERERLASLPKSSNNCLNLQRDKFREFVNVYNRCDYKIRVKLCLESKTVAVLKLLGSLVARETCKTYEGGRGLVTSFLFASDDSTGIWQLLSDAKYRVSATRSR